MSKTVLFQIIRFSRSRQFKCKKTILFQTIQFSISIQFNSIWPIDKILTIILFSIISRKVIEGGFLPLSRDAVGVFYCPSRLGHRICRSYIHIYIIVGDRSRGRPEGSFSIATTSRSRGRRYSFSWIAPLYPWSVPYNTEC